jgi:uncharacterized membrane protein YebE (DUF533 family)
MRELGTLFSLVNIALGMRGKRHARASRYLTGGSHPFLNASTIMGAAGLAVGLFETFRARQAYSAAPAPVRPGTTELRSGAGAPPPPAAGREVLDAGLARLVRLTVSAARADGAISASERERCLVEARAGGVEGLMRAELDRQLPLAEIVAGVTDPAHKRDLYTLAYCVVRADEGVSGAERIYLAQFAALLALDAPTVQAIERDADARIDD